MKKIEGFRQCKQCKTQKPMTEYLPVKRGWRVDKCNACACANMKRYWHKVETDPDKVRRRAVDE